jgi:hypothetical protein
MEKIGNSSPFVLSPLLIRAASSSHKEPFSLHVLLVCAFLRILCALPTTWLPYTPTYFHASSGSDLRVVIASSQGVHVGDYYL